MTIKYRPKNIVRPGWFRRDRDAVTKFRFTRFDFLACLFLLFGIAFALEPAYVVDHGEAIFVIRQPLATAKCNELADAYTKLHGANPAAPAISAVPIWLGDVDSGSAASAAPSDSRGQCKILFPQFQYGGLRLPFGSSARYGISLTMLVLAVTVIGLRNKLRRRVA
jgi:hypothetical protein